MLTQGRWLHRTFASAPAGVLWGVFSEVRCSEAHDQLLIIPTDHRTTFPRVFREGDNSPTLGELVQPHISSLIQRCLLLLLSFLLSLLWKLWKPKVSGFDLGTISCAYPGIIWWTCPWLYLQLMKVDCYWGKSNGSLFPLEEARGRHVWEARLRRDSRSLDRSKTTRSRLLTRQTLVRRGTCFFRWPDWKTIRFWKPCLTGFSHV